MNLRSGVVLATIVAVAVEAPAQEEQPVDPPRTSWRPTSTATALGTSTSA